MGLSAVQHPLAGPIQERSLLGMPLLGGVAKPSGPSPAIASSMGGARSSRERLGLILLVAQQPLAGPMQEHSLLGMHLACQAMASLCIRKGLGMPCWRSGTFLSQFSGPAVLGWAARACPALCVPGSFSHLGHLQPLPS